MLIRISIPRKFDSGHTFLPTHSITIAHASLYQMMATRASICRYERRSASGSCLCHRRFVFYRHHMMPRFRLLRTLLVLLIFSGVLAAQSDDLLSRIWQGIGQAQHKYTSSCGTLTETRTSSLMAKPLVLRGKFCAEGTTRFALDYFEPSSMRIRFNENYLNVTAGDKTEVMEIGKSVRRAQSYFGRDHSLVNLKKNFTITVQEDNRDYQMKLVPRTDAFRGRLNYLVVKLDKQDFFPRSLEVDGKSGVNSVFAIDVSSMNPKLPADTFEVYKPQ
jgi:outer membrane lipoprotein-sorting protein